MDLQKRRTHHAVYGWRPAGIGATIDNGWRAFSKFKTFLLWASGINLGMSLMLILWKLEAGGAWPGLIVSIYSGIAALGLAFVVLFTAAKFDQPAGEGTVSGLEGQGE